MIITDIRPLGRSALKIIDYVSPVEVILVIAITILILYIIIKVIK